MTTGSDNGRAAKKTGRKRLGAWGESVAATHLESLGYVIVSRNWHCRQGEIDLVAQAGEELAFVEVKTRRGRSMGTPEEGLTPAKSRKLIDLAQRYLAEHDLDVDWRIDLVAVELDSSGKLLRCEHIPNAVLGW
ncbi:MAG: YraN family protein [Chloroflexi bacterium]|nr:YraN family protein [Chloroflexota bacterium]